MSDTLETNTPTAKEAPMTDESKTETSTETPKPKSKRVRNRKRKSKAAATPKIKVHTLLFDLISSTPGITREAVLVDTGLRSACLTPKGLAGVKAADKLETKRWGRKINRFLRQIRRDGHDVIVTRTKTAVTYAIAGTETVDTAEEVIEVIKTPDASRDAEEADQLLTFDSLLAELDDDPNFPVGGQTEEMKSKKLLF